VSHSPLRRVSITAIGVVAIFLVAVPVYWMVSSAFKKQGDIQT
jgi:ABC-type glycerol-3-phosphate transport system permease component